MGLLPVEAAATPNVALLALAPDPQQRILKVSAEAKDQEAMLEFVRRLAFDAPSAAFDAAFSSKD